MGIIKACDIGHWCTYQTFTDKEQIQLQRDNLIYTGLNNANGDITFIFDKYICKLNNYITLKEKDIRVIDAETTIENEIYYTTKIEGAKTTRVRTSEIRRGLSINLKNAYSEYMVKNAFNAVKALNLYGDKITVENLITVWKILTENCCDNIDIRGDRFRIGDVEIGRHKGAPVEKLEELMQSFVDFYNSELFDSYPFIKAILLHFAFESIHPFCDGNGRLGRLLINNYLISRGIESSREVSFSMFIDKRRAEYDVALDKSENLYNDCTPLVEYMLEIFYEAYEEAYNTQNS